MDCPAVQSQIIHPIPKLKDLVNEDIYSKLLSQNIRNGMELLSWDVEELSSKAKVSYKVKM